MLSFISMKLFHRPERLTHTEAIDLALLDDIHRFNQSFIRDGSERWDRVGYGCFAVFLRYYLAKRWRRLTRLN